MKVMSESDWQYQLSALDSDGEVGQAFAAFLTDWVDTTEEAMTRLQLGAADALRSALAPVEGRRGHWSIGYVGQMLAVIVNHWVHGTELVEGLTTLELHLLGDVAAIKQERMARDATTNSTPATPKL